MRHVHKTTSEVTGVSCLQGGVGKTLTSTVSRDKVLQHGHTFLKVRKNGVFDNLGSFGTGFLRLGHQTTHTGKLCNLVCRTTSTGIEHHEHCVEALVSLCHLFHECTLQVGVNVRPCINYLIVTFVVGNETHVIVHGDLVDFFITTLHEVYLFFRDNNIVKVEGKTAFVGHAITKVLDTIKEFASTSHTYTLNNLGDDIAQRFLRDNGIDIAHFLRNNFVHDDATH